MSVPEFPSFLPRVSDSFSVELRQPVERTQFESGLARQRLLFDKPTRLVQVVWDFNNSEWGIFEAFHRLTLNFGVKWFTIDLPIGHEVETTECRFVDGSYKKSYYGNFNWKISATLETLNDYGLTQSELDQGISDNAGGGGGGGGGSAGI